jgi:hypothetical protein
MVLQKSGRRDADRCDRDGRAPREKGPGIAVVPTAVARVSRGTPGSFGGTPKDATATVALPKP